MPSTISPETCRAMGPGLGTLVPPSHTETTQLPTIWLQQSEQFDRKVHLSSAACGEHPIQLPTSEFFAASCAMGLQRPYLAERLRKCLPSPTCSAHRTASFVAPVPMAFLTGDFTTKAPDFASYGVARWQPKLSLVAAWRVAEINLGRRCISLNTTNTYLANTLGLGRMLC